MQSDEPAHSPYGPSSAERWLNCPASIRATKGMPDTDSDWSTEGTAAHTLSEWARNENKPAAFWLGEKIPVEQVDGTIEEIEVDQEMVNAVQEFMDYVQQFNGDHLVEVRVYYTEYVPNGFGTLDHATLQYLLGRITDLKYGKGVQVFAENNEQLMCYALAILLMFDDLYHFEKFILTIHQPRLDHVDSWTILRDDLLGWARDVLVPGYERTLNSNAEFNPGEWCRFCKIKGTCRARAEHTFRVLQGEFTNLDQFAPAPADQLTNDELARIRVHFANIKAFMSAVDERLTHILMRGEKAEDLKLVDGKSAREWSLSDAEIVARLIKIGLKKKDIYEEPAIRSVAQLEKLIPNGSARLKKATAKKPAGDLAALVRVIPGKPTIANGDDKRPARALKPEDEFVNLDGEMSG